VAHWGFWEWLGYASLWITGIILAVDAGLKMSAASLRQKLLAITESRAWAFAPLVLLVIGTGALLNNQFGWIGGTASEATLKLQYGNAGTSPVEDSRSNIETWYNLNALEGGITRHVIIFVTFNRPMPNNSHFAVDANGRQLNWHIEQQGPTHAIIRIDGDPTNSIVTFKMTKP
jgi:hypothetical protein